MPPPSDTKIAFRSTYYAMRIHQRICGQCREYLDSGEGDLCATGNGIVAHEMVYGEADVKERTIPSTLE